MLRVAMTDPANPFAPPLAAVSDPDEVRVLAPARKPVAVWLMQGLGALAIFWMVGAVFTHVPEFLLAGVGGMAILLAVGAPYMLYFVVLVRDCQRRQRRGRRMGLTVLFVILLFSLLMAVSEWLLVGNVVGRSRGGAVAAQGVSWLLLAGTIAWGWRFGFTAQARAWFGMDDAGAAKG